MGRRSLFVALLAPLLGGSLAAKPALSTPFTDASRCEAVLAPYEAVYASSYGGLQLEGRRSLRVSEAGSVVLSHDVEHIGSRISEQTLLKTEQHHLRVYQYDKVQSIFGIRREDHAHFDWAHRVIRTRGHRERELPLDGVHYDPLSYQLALRCDMAQGKQEVRYQVVRRGKVKRFVFRRVGTEQLDTPLGRIDTLVVERVRDTDERSTRIWLAPSLRFLLVQLQQHDKEDDFDVTLLLTAVEFRDPPDP